MQLFCIDDSNKPAYIPEDKWIQKNHFYIAIYIGECADGSFYVVLHEPGKNKDSIHYAYEFERFLVFNVEKEYQAWTDTI